MTVRVGRPDRYWRMDPEARSILGLPDLEDVARSVVEQIGKNVDGATLREIGRRNKHYTLADIEDGISWCIMCGLVRRGAYRECTPDPGVPQHKIQETIYLATSADIRRTAKIMRGKKPLSYQKLVRLGADEASIGEMLVIGAAILVGDKYQLAATHVRKYNGTSHHPRA